MLTYEEEIQLGISVIIPTYNREEALKIVLPLYSKQKNVEEIIIIDDGSDPPISQEISNVSHLITVHRSQHRGLTAARNTGITLAKGEYIFFGEDDGYPAEGVFERLMHTLNNESMISAVGCRAVYLEKGEIVNKNPRDQILCSGVPFNVQILDFDNTSAFDNTVEVPYMTPWALIRREIFKNVAFDEKIAGNFYREETDFWLQANRAGYRLLYDPQAVMIHIRTDQGGCHTQSRLLYEWWCLRNTLYVYQKHANYLRQSWNYRGSPIISSLVYSMLRLMKLLKTKVRAAFGQSH